MKKVSRKSKKGFTLVELLVVIGIIGILAAIILPRFTGYTEKAIMKEATSQARAYYTHLSSEYAEKGQYPTKQPELTAAGIVNKRTEIAISDYKEATGDFTLTLTRGSKAYTVTYTGGVMTEKIN